MIDLTSRKYILAPMSGITHAAFRKLVDEEGGCDILCTEMLSARAVLRESPRHSPYAIHIPVSSPVVAQIVGNDPVVMADAGEKLLSLFVDGIDINMSCPAPKILKSGWGAGLMGRRELAVSVIREVRRRVGGFLSVKLRVGEDWNAENLLSFAQMVEDEGVDAVILHPRVFSQKFRGISRWEYIKMLKENLSIPVVGSGDVFSPMDAESMFNETGADAVMIGRGAVIRPWIFRLIKGGEEPQDKGRIALRFVELLEEYFPEERILGRVKQFITWYSEGFFFGHTLRKWVQRARAVEEAKQYIRRFFYGQRG